MPSEAPNLQTQTEKPHHYTYLKEFRTQQCPLFLQHKCTQHRPFTCFHWHFTNQRRRRPIRRRDGTFNYSPDVYCTKYDETTGLCPEGDDCGLLHRTAGDTERRYHLRYYKTSACVHETDSKGHCVKNGPHCAFAHGAHDLRPPVYDIREVQTLDINSKETTLTDTPLGTSLEKDRNVNDDPRWNDTNYVLANYKTEQCKRPPRLCRQGYACPQYHNSRDKRRTPKKYKYRSTPCPNVKHGDDWGDPAQCENGENCSYCHTRTEQQFHPEIYKSTKCNDMVQTGYCPRGPFCAFAHVEQEMTTQREMSIPSENSLGAFLTSALPSLPPQTTSNNGKMESGGLGRIEETRNCNERQLLMPKHSTTNGQQNGNSNNSSNSNMIRDVVSSLPEPIGKGRTGSITSMTSDCSSSSYHKAPGSEREDSQVKLKQQMQSIDNDPNLDIAEKSQRKQNLLLLHSLNVSNPIMSANYTSTLASSPTTPSSTVSSAMSPHAPSFYPPGDTVESVIGNALEEDLDLGELTLSSLDRDLIRDNDNDNNSVCSSVSTGFPSTCASNFFGTSSVPVTIPSGGYQRTSISSLSQSPSSPLGSLQSSFMAHPIQLQQKQEQQIHEAEAAFLSHPNPGKYSAPGFSDFNSMSPRSNSISQSPLLGSSTFAANGYGEMQRLREELAATKSKLLQWEEGIGQARNACEAWKKEAEESTRKAKQTEDEKQQIMKQRDEVVIEITKLKREVEHLRSGPFLHCIKRVSELQNLPLQHLHTMQSQLRSDLETLEKIIFQQTGMGSKW